MPHEVGGNVDRMPNERPLYCPEWACGTEGAVGTTELLVRLGRGDKPAGGRQSREGRPEQAGRTRPCCHGGTRGDCTPGDRGSTVVPWLHSQFATRRPSPFAT